MVRYTKRITPDETNQSYRDGEYINYTFPQNIIDLHSVAKYFTASVDSVEEYNDDTNLKRFLPPNSSAIIDSIQIKRDGEIVQYIQEYALLNQMYVDIDDKHEHNSDSSKSNTVSYNYVDANNFEVKTDEFYNSVEPAKSYKYCISNWLGFLNGDNRYLDCRGKQVQLTIKLSPKYIAYRGLKIYNLNVNPGVNPNDPVNPNPFPTDYHYFITDCFMNMTVVHNENIDIKNNISFEDYSHFKSMRNTSSKNAVVKGRTDKNIRYMLTTFTDNTRNTDSGLQFQHMNELEAKFRDKIKDTCVDFDDLNDTRSNGDPVVGNYSIEHAKNMEKPNQLNNSIYFKRTGIDVQTNQYRVNGVEISPPYTSLESFNNIKNTFQTKLQKAKTLASFETDFFMNVQEYNSGEKEISVVEWVINGENRNVGGEGHLFLVHDKSVQF